MPQAYRNSYAVYQPSLCADFYTQAGWPIGRILKILTLTEYSRHLAPRYPDRQAVPEQIEAARNTDWIRGKESDMKTGTKVVVTTMVAAGIAFAGLAWAQEQSSKPADPAKTEEMKPAADKPMVHMATEHREKMQKMMKENSESVEKAIKDLEAAKASDDTAKLKGAIDEAVKSLRETHGKMKECHEMMASGSAMMEKMGEKIGEKKAEIKEKKEEMKEKAAEAEKEKKE
jgi:hypothetical protein